MESAKNKLTVDVISGVLEAWSVCLEQDCPAIAPFFVTEQTARAGP